MKCGYVVRRGGEIMGVCDEESLYQQLEGPVAFCLEHAFAFRQECPEVPLIKRNSEIREGEEDPIGVIVHQMNSTVRDDGLPPVLYVYLKKVDEEWTMVARRVPSPSSDEQTHMGTYLLVKVSDVKWE